MQKNQIIGLLIISLIIFVYMAVIWPQYYTKPTQPAKQSAISRDTTEQVVISISTAQVPIIQVPGIDSTLLEKKRDMVIDTDLYRAKFSNFGGHLTSFRLKEIKVTGITDINLLEKELFNAEQSKDQTNVEFIKAEIDKLKLQEDYRKKGKEARDLNDTQKANEYADLAEELDWVELVTQNQYLPKPFELELGNWKNIENITPFNYSTSRLILNERHKTDQLILTGTLPNGLVIEKTYHFLNDNYIINFDLRLYNPTDRSIQLVDNSVGYKLYIGAGLGELQTYSKSRYDSGVQASVKWDNKVKLIPLSQKKPVFHESGNIQWVALQSNYFYKGFVLPNLSLATTLLAQNTTLGRAFTPSLCLEIPPLDIPVKYESKQSYVFYIGPKKMENLKALKVPVEEILFPGWLQLINLWILKTLKWCYLLTGNYGVAVILISVLLKIITFPLTHISFKSMKRMQMLAPEMKALQEKYKEDPTRQQKEVMALYRKHKVNPMSGCLPLLIQMPIFIALYNVLGKAIELRGAHFIFWMKDLSRPDTVTYLLGLPINILPLLMGATMWLQQKMTTTPDPKSAMMSQMMTLFFLFIFWNMPSGLVLYWFITNLLSILQQHYINKQEIPVHLPHGHEKK